MIAGLASAGAYAVSAELVSLSNMIPSWGFQALLTALFLYSYFRSGRAASQLSLTGSLPKAVEVRND